MTKFVTKHSNFNGSHETVNQPSYDFEGSSPSSPTIFKSLTN